MQKTKIVVRFGAAALILSLAFCAFFVAHKDNDENRGLYAPNCMHRIAVPLPCPPACDQNEQFTAMIKSLDTTGLIAEQKTEGPIRPWPGGTKLVSIKR